MLLQGAAHSIAADGASIVTYAWELDESGAGREAAEFDDASGPTLFLPLQLPANGAAIRTIGLRVTDSNGLEDVVFHELHFSGTTGPSTELDVRPDPAGADVSAIARAAARRAHRPRGRRFRARLRGASLALDLAAMTIRGPVGRIRRVPADGRLVVRMAGSAGSGGPRILGGTGAAARLAARARFRVHAAGGALRLRGRVRTRARPARLPPPGCGRT